MAIEKLVIPDFGGAQDITVVDVYIKAGDTVAVEDSLLGLESEKAVMDIPSPFAGTITEVLVEEEAVVASGDVIALIEVGEMGGAEGKGESRPEESAAAEPEKTADQSVVEEQEERPAHGGNYHATPSVRGYARSKGMDLAGISGSGPKGRIIKEDIDKAAGGQGAGGVSSQSAAAGQSGVVDADLVEIYQLGRIQKISGPHLQRSWQEIPHVTQFEEADIEELNTFRKKINSERKEGDPSFSFLVFVVKAVVAGLKQFPLFNASLQEDGGSVELKKYYNIGIAVDTPDGLVVPVIKNADTLSLTEIRDELGRLSSAARSGKLSINDIQGATFTISSLGGIGGTGFTPIISSPQVAILGLSRSFIKPVYDGQGFVPRMTLPFSLSYDHRVIDGAEAARFCVNLRLHLEDLKRTLL